jgi:hypothetical protein
MQPDMNACAPEEKAKPPPQLTTLQPPTIAWTVAPDMATAVCRSWKPQDTSHTNVMDPVTLTPV